MAAFFRSWGATFWHGAYAVAEFYQFVSSDVSKEFGCSSG